MNVVSLFQARSRYFYFFLVILSLVGSLTSIGLLMLINTALGTKAVLFMGKYNHLIFIALIALSYTVGIAFQVYMVRLTNDIMFNLEMTLIKKVRNASFESFEKMGTEKIYAALSDIRILARFPEIFVILLNSTVTIVCSMLYLFWVSPAACITVLGLMSVLMVFYLYQNKKIEKNLNKIRDLQDGYYDSLRELLAGFRQIRISNLRSSNIFNKHLLSNRTKSRDLSTDTSRKVIINEMTGSHSWYIVLGIVIFVLPLLYNIQLMEVTAFITTVLFLISPVSQILNSVPFYTSFKIAVERIDRITSRLETDSVSSDQLRDAPATFNSIRFENIVYSYNREDETSFELRLSDLRIDSNEIIFFIGGNGSGKTTFINLLTGLCRPNQGNIYIDGQPVSWEEYCAFRNNMAVVYTNHHLFKENYDEHQYHGNAAFGHYVHHFNLHGIVKVDPNNRIDTNLSKGQQKRLSLLMALMERKPILILDEWAAEQDPKNRALFYQEWLEEIRGMGKTIIAVSHDDDFYYEADRVIKFDFGRIVSDTRKEKPAVAVN